MAKPKNSNPNGIACRRCGCHSWNMFSTSTQRLDTASKTADASDYVRREYRCQGCGIKSTSDQFHQLEALLKQPGWNL